jgi:hypothetical protein
MCQNQFTWHCVQKKKCYLCLTRKSKMTDVTQDEFKQWVKEYRRLGAEIKESSSLLTAIRKRQKELEENIQTYMQDQGIPSVKLGEETIGRFEKTSLGPVNADLIKSVAAQFLNDDSQGDQFTALIYSSRPEKVTEVLKVTKDKKRKLRPVDA